VTVGATTLGWYRAGHDPKATFLNDRFEEIHLSFLCRTIGR
jgi:hypothetical protein